MFCHPWEQVQINCTFDVKTINNHRKYIYPAELEVWRLDFWKRVGVLFNRHLYKCTIVYTFMLRTWLTKWEHHWQNENMTDWMRTWWKSKNMTEWENDWQSDNMTDWVRTWMTEWEHDWLNENMTNLVRT